MKTPKQLKAAWDEYSKLKFPKKKRIYIKRKPPIIMYGYNTCKG